MASSVIAIIDFSAGNNTIKTKEFLEQMGFIVHWYVYDEKEINAQLEIDDLWPYYSNIIVIRN